MIEDDDMFRQNESLPPEEKEEGHSHLMLFIFIGWLIWSAALSVFFIPKVITAVNESGVLALIEAELDDRSSAIETRDISAYFVTLEGKKEFFFKTERRGGTKYHDIVEALIEGAPTEALEEGAISLISPETELIGLSYGNGICYVDLSSEFLESPSLGSYTAADELRDSLRQDGIEKVVIMIEGEVQNL